MTLTAFIFIFSSIILHSLWHFLCKSSGKASMSFYALFSTSLFLTMLPGALLILMSMSVRHILEAGGILDTILYLARGLLTDMSPHMAILVVYAIVLALQFFISSAASKAFLILPLIAPLADMVGLTRQTIGLAFCCGDGFTNVFFPTNALLLIVLGMTGVPYAKWFKWTWKLQLTVLVLTALVLLFAVQVGYV